MDSDGHPAVRAAAVERLAGCFRQRMGEMAEVITAEMGCPITASRLGQVGEAYAAWNYFAELGRTLTWEEERPGRLGPSRLRRA